MVEQLTSAMRCHDEHTYVDTSAESTAVLVGLTGGEGAFAADFKAGRWFVHRDHKDVVSRHWYAVGGHYAAHPMADVLAGRLRRFCRDPFSGHLGF